MQDAVAVWEAVLGEEKPPTVLVGHSMGGAIATWAASLQVRYPVTPFVNFAVGARHATEPSHGQAAQSCCLVCACLQRCCTEQGCWRRHAASCRGHAPGAPRPPGLPCDLKPWPCRRSPRWRAWW